jgi:CSLREA domain-containing protein
MKHTWTLTLGTLSLFSLVALLFAMPIAGEAGGGVFTVNSVDDLDDGTCDGSHCSLREAINAVNANAGPQYIYFDIPGSGPHEISLCSMLPALTDEGTLIDGTTEPDYVANGPVVVIKPGPFSISALPACTPPPIGLWISTSDVVVRGLSIIGFKSISSPIAAGIAIHNGTDNIVELNFIGLDAAGSPVGNRDGIVIAREGQEIRGNRISANAIGIHTLGDGQWIHSNFIGTDPTGVMTSPALGNQIGILVEAPSSNVEIGGGGPILMNLISGNTVGVEIRSDSNFVRNNRIGTDASGTGALGNDTGVLISGNDNHIESNQISDSNIGLLLAGDGNTVSGNLIGTDKTGDVALPNNTGIHVTGNSNVIGGSIPISVPPGTPSGNIISGNSLGINLSGGHQNHIYGNKIGAANSADTALPNQTGIEMNDAYENVIGSDHLPHEANWVMHNYDDGIRIMQYCQGNLITGNYIDWNGRGIYSPALAGISSGNTFHHNFIYHNTQLGIDLGPPGVTPNDPGDVDGGPNLLLNFPEIISATTSSVTGVACADCTVELFDTDDDASGHGEGMSPFAEVLADASGNFSISSIHPMYNIDVCDTITATATDPMGNTSEFALNFVVNPCLTMNYPLFVLIGVVFLLAGGVAGRRLGRGRRVPAGWAAAGGAAGLGLVAVFSLLPFVKIGTPEGPVPPESLGAALPPCSQFLDTLQFFPEDGAVLEDEQFSFAWGWLLEPPAGQVRWRLDLHGPEGTEASQVTDGTSLPFSTFGLSPSPGSLFQWRLTGEQSAAGETTWQPFCQASPWLSFRIGPPPPLSAPPWELETPTSPTPTPTVTPTPTPTPSSIPSACIYEALQNTNCRESDYQQSALIAILLQGEMAELVALNPEFTHGEFIAPSMQQCWIWLGLMDGPENPLKTCGVPVIDPPPPPPTATSTPVPACRSDLDQAACEASGGTWSRDLTGAAGCVCPG